MQELFQLFGELGVKTDNAFKQIDQIERKVRKLAKQFGDDLTADININDNASKGLDNVGDSAEQARLRLQQLEDMARSVEQQLSEQIDINVADSSVVKARNDLRLLQREIDRVRNNLGTNVNAQAPFQGAQTTVGAGNIQQTKSEVEQLKRTLATLQNQLKELDGNGTSKINFKGMTTNVNGLLSSLETVERELGRIQSQVDRINDTGLNLDGSVNVEQQGAFNNLQTEMAGLSTSLAALTAATIASTAEGGFTPFGSGRNLGYDINRVFQQQTRMNQMMLQYAQRMTPMNSLGQVRERLDVGAGAFPHMPNAKTMLEMQALMGMADSSLTQARRQLSQLGFARTGKEVKSLEAQLYNLGNIRMDSLKDQIALTEKGLKEMKSSANADELVEEIRRAEDALKRYKKEMKDAEPFNQLARTSGHTAHKIFGKDVFVKPWKSQLDRMGGMLDQFFNRDVARLMNQSYTQIDSAAKRIVGAQTTAVEQKQKIMQLQTRYMTLGMMINQFVTPAVLGLAAAFALVGKAAEEGYTKFQAQTLTTNKDMQDFKEMITDASVATGASQKEVGELFSVLHNQLGKTKANIQQAATMGLYFKKVWGVDAAQAVSTVDNIAKELGISTGQAQSILSLALKKHQGDIQAATKDVMEHEKAWKNASKAGSEGAKAYDQMVAGIDNGAITRFARAFRQMGAAMLELWKQLEPTLTSIANKITAVAQATTEWLRANPGMASFLAHAIAIGGAFVVLVGLFAPVASLLIRFRGLFQGVAHAIGLAGRGAAVMSPQVRILMDTLKMGQNAILGLPRVIAGIFPAMIAMLRSAPGALAAWVINFVKMNPLLATFGALIWVIQKNWERFQPVLASIWDSIKRIGDAIFGAFAGPGGDAADGFGNMMDMLAKILGDVLLPVLKIVAVLVEALAVVMENGGGKFVAAGVAMWFFGGALGRVIPMLGMFKGALTAIFGPFGRVFALIRGIGPMLVAGLARIGSLLARIPLVFGLVARGLAMLGPLLLNPWTWVVLAIVGIGVLIFRNWDKIKAGTIRIWNSITSWLKNNWKSLLAFATGPFGLIALVISKNWNSIKSSTTRTWNAIKNFLKSTWNSIANFTKSISKSIRDFVVNTWTNLKNRVSSITKSLKDAIIKLWTSLKNSVTNMARAIRDAVISAFNRLKTSAINAVTTMRNKVRDAFNYLVGKARSFGRTLSGILKNMWNGLKGMGKSAWNWGKNIIEGLIGGITSMWGKLKRVVGGVVDSIKSGITKALGIHSPSRVMKGYGVNIGEGLEMGIRKTVAMVGRASNALSGAVKSPDPIHAQVHVSRNIASAMGGVSSPTARVTGSSKSVTNNNNSGVTIQSAKFELKVEKLQTAEDVAKLRKVIQNVVSDDLFGMAVRNV